MIDVRHSFLPAVIACRLKNKVESMEFPWHFCENSINIKQQTISSLKYSQFAHILFSDDTPVSPFFHTFSPILHFIEDRFNTEISSIVKFKINFLQNNKDVVMHYPHCDHNSPGFTSFVYYLNTSDGDTNFYDECANEDTPTSYHTDDSLTLLKSITPHFNSIVRFDSARYHSYYTPVRCNKRYVINLVVKLNEHINQ